ncbi:U32 family peptidase [Peptoniphilus sp. AGMB00490]|uniref:U32 family peptidase n=1 Tax=Peptoniphilus faecalis TaxID=2731255 RepID=A0A848RI09_9FIRM|nr:U32 family peptidase [Peptoniphilus faecalis]NMW85625.1 U32 family peptidase [Peptoniphilus faecalis]
MKKNKYELLAPAGDMACLKAAVSAGANAVYLGYDEFSARAKAKNFNKEELIEAINYAHLRNVKIYVTFNILIADFEVKRAMESVKMLYDIGVDALILQDIGISSEIRKNFPDFEVHASTQMAVNNFYGAKLLKNMGFSRVVLARETPIFELEKIKELDIEVETFIHGALCVSYSGECLMSSMIGGKSGNRGECAQACRKSYEILDFNGNIIGKRLYYISPKDLNTLDDVAKIIKSGGYSLKIEGRMKNPEYVYTVVSSYKKSLENKLTLEDREDTEQVFNRGFTKGLFNGDFGNNFISSDRPDNRGVEVGKVIEVTKNLAKVIFDVDIYQGDGIEFLSNKGRFGMRSVKLYTSKIPHEISLSKTPILNSKINRTYSKRLYGKVDEKIENSNYKRDLDVNLKIKIGEKPTIKVRSGDHRAFYELDKIVEIAKKSGLNRERVVENISKTGDSIFKVKNISMDLDENAFLSISAINELRREVIGILESKILKDSINRVEIQCNLENKKIENKDKKSKIKIFFNKFKNLEKSNLENIDEIIIRAKDLKKFSEKYNKEVSIYLDKFYSYNELENLREYLLKIENVKGIWINNLSEYYIFKDDGIKINGDIGLNVFNKLSLDFFKNLGFNSITLSPELNSGQIQKITINSDAEINVISYGRVPVMTMKHCPFSVIKNCVDERNCPSCKFKNYLLRDEKSVDFEVLRQNTFTEIFNSYPILLDGYVKKLVENNVSLLLLADEFTDEVVELYKNYEEENFKRIKKELEDKYRQVTKGHINRGIVSG